MVMISWYESHPFWIWLDEWMARRTYETEFSKINAVLVYSQCITMCPFLYTLV